MRGQVVVHPVVCTRPGFKPPVLTCSEEASQAMEQCCKCLSFSLSLSLPPSKHVTSANNGVMKALNPSINPSDYAF